MIGPKAMKKLLVPLAATIVQSSIQASAMAAEFNSAKCLINERWSHCKVELSGRSIRMELFPSASKEVKSKNKGKPEQSPVESIVIDGGDVQEYAYMNRSDLKSNVPVVVLGAVLIPFTFGLSADALAAKRSEHQYVYAMRVRDDQSKSILFPERSASKTYVVELNDFKQSTRFYPYLREVTGLEMGIKRP